MTSTLPPFDATGQSGPSDLTNGGPDTPICAYPTDTCTPDLPPPPTLVCDETGGQDCSPVIVCHEDMPCWDCSTMGNMTCGPTTTVPLPSYSEPTLPVTGPELALVLAPLSLALIMTGIALIRTSKKAGHR